MHEIKIKFKPAQGNSMIISLDEAKEKLNKIMPSEDVKYFEKEILSGTYLGYNRNHFELYKEK